MATGRENVSSQATHVKWMSGREHLKLRKNINIGMWNVRGLLQVRKFHTLENELARENMAIWGITETHWKDSGYFKTTNNTIYISGATQTGKNGVVISVDNKTVKSVKEYLPISDRLIKILLTAHPINFHILLAYMPTSDSTDEENNYGKIVEVISRILQKNILIVCGRF